MKYHRHRLSRSTAVPSSVPSWLQAEPKVKYHRHRLSQSTVKCFSSSIICPIIDCKQSPKWNIIVIDCALAVPSSVLSSIASRAQSEISSSSIVQVNGQVLQQFHQLSHHRLQSEPKASLSLPNEQPRHEYCDICSCRHKPTIEISLHKSAKVEFPSHDLFSNGDGGHNTSDRFQINCVVRERKKYYVRKNFYLGLPEAIVIQHWSSYFAAMHQFGNKQDRWHNMIRLPTHYIRHNILIQTLTGTRESVFEIHRCTRMNHCVIWQTVK